MPPPTRSWRQTSTLRSTSYNPTTFPSTTRATAMTGGAPCPRCACGAFYRFHLGSRSLSVGEVAATGRWSTDVTLPIYLNDLASGIVAGRSSAMYGMVLNEVLEKVLGRRPVPMLLPPDLPGVLAARDETKSLLQRYVMGS